MSKKQLGINLISNIISFTVSFGLNFILTPYLIAKIGKEAYSFYPLANNFISYINLLVIALNSMAARFIMLEIMKKNISKANVYFNSVFYSNILIVLALIIPFSMGIMYINQILKIPAHLQSEIQILFSLVFLTFLMSVSTSVFSVATIAKNRIDLRSIQEIIQSGLKAILFIGLFTIFSPSIAYVGIVSLIVGLAGSLMSFYFTKRLLPNIHLSLKYYQKTAVFKLLSSGIWSSFNQLSLILLTGLDLLLANIFLGAAKAGEYSIAQTVPIFVSSLIVMLVGVFVPQLANYYAKNDINGLVKEIDFSGKVLGILITTPICGFIVFGEEFYRLWIPSENASFLHLLSVIIFLPYMLNGSINVLFNVNVILNKVKTPSIVLFCTGLINVGLVLILLNYTNLGLLAIPISSVLLSFIRNLTFTPIYSAKCLSIKWYSFYNLVLRNLLTVVVLISLFYFIKSFNEINTWLEFIITASFCAIVGFTCSSLFMLNRSQLQKLIGLIIKRINKRNIS